MSVPDRKQEPSSARRVAVVGGGITGLAAAHRLSELLPHGQTVLFEATGRLGGVLETVNTSGFLIERSADSFITKFPWAVDLCRRVGLTPQLLPTHESGRRAAVVRNGKLHRIPKGFLIMEPQQLWPILTSSVLSPWGKLRLLAEPWVARKPTEEDNTALDESVASFATRRLGREVFERLVQPLLAGIYTADPQKLSMAATMPQFLESEAQLGSLLRAQWDRKRNRKEDSQATPESGARYGMFLAPAGGMGSLVEAIEKKLKVVTIRRGTAVERIEKQDSGQWRLAFSAQPAAESFDAVILALPGPSATRLLHKTNADLANQFDKIEYASSVVVSTGFRRDQFCQPLDGFGFVVPQIEARRIIATSYASEKFPGRAPSGYVLVRTFVGGALQPELVAQSEQDLIELVLQELSSLLGIRGDPQVVDVARWDAAMPQYHVGHLDRVNRIEQQIANQPGLEIASNAFQGVGIPQCVHSGEQAAERVADWLCRS